MVRRIRLRRKLLIVTGVLALALLAALSDLRWRLYGLVSGQPTYRGLPASYYARRITESGWGLSNGPLGGYGHITWGTQPRLLWGARWQRGSVETWVRQNVGDGIAGLFWSPQRFETLFDREPAALPVLAALLNHSDQPVKVHALGWLASMGTDGRPAEPAVAALLADPNMAIRQYAEITLRYVQTGR